MNTPKYVTEPTEVDVTWLAQNVISSGKNGHYLKLIEECWFLEESLYKKSSLEKIVIQRKMTKVKYKLDNHETLYPDEYI